MRRSPVNLADGAQERADRARPAAERTRSVRAAWSIGASVISDHGLAPAAADGRDRRDLGAGRDDEAVVGVFRIDGDHEVQAAAGRAPGWSRRGRAGGRRRWPLRAGRPRSRAPRRVAGQGEQLQADFACEAPPRGADARLAAVRAEGSSVIAPAGEFNRGRQGREPNRGSIFAGSIGSKSGLLRSATGFASAGADGTGKASGTPEGAIPRPWNDPGQGREAGDMAEGGRAGGHPGPGGTGPQPPRHRRRHPARPARRPDRRERLGQEFAGVRHALRRGPAALHRGPLQLRPAVPRPARTARRRRDRRPAADRLDRPAQRVGQPAEHGRDRHRDPRLPPPPLRPRRHPALPELRPGDPPADARADGRGRARRWGEGRKVLVLAPLVRGRKGQHADAFAADPPRGAAPGPGRRRRSSRFATSRPEAREDQGPRHRGRRRPPGRPRGHPPPAGRERRPGPEARRRGRHPLGPGRATAGTTAS